MRVINNSGMATSFKFNSENLKAFSGSGFKMLLNLGNNNLKGLLNDWFVVMFIIMFFLIIFFDLKI